MALKPCRECGNRVSTEAHSCPHCGAPVKPQTLSSAPQEEQLERELYRRGELVVTTRRFIVGGKTYAMRGVTSVAINRKPPPTRGWLLGCGLFIAVIALAMILEVNPSDPEQRRTGIGLAVIAALLLLGSYSELRRPSPPSFFSVVLTSASGEQTAYGSTDEDVVREIVACLNQAIAARD